MCDRKLFMRGLDRLGVRLANDEVDRLQLYCNELLKWNKRINLIARNTTADEALEKHFLDSLILQHMIRKHGGEGTSLLDVGSGAGFPGLVIAAVMPQLSVTLVEPRQKRVSFLRHIVRTLGIANVRIVESRLEQAGLNGNDFFFITSRAVADTGRFLAMVENVSGPKTFVILMQAESDHRQLNEGIQRYGWQLQDKMSFTLPFTGAPRSLFLIQKGIA